MQQPPAMHDESGDWPQLPGRYLAQQRLGSGGAGEVWAVKDRYTGQRLALKLLSQEAQELERESLVKEAIALSGLEGLGVPRVLRFGRVRSSHRVYLLRELVEGRSLQELIEGKVQPERALSALACTAEQLTRLHRAELLHGDVKPANIIVSDAGEATLVDLGLSEPLRERGARARGLTPKYAAPELLAGKPLTVRAEIYALGVALGDIVEAEGDRLGATVRPLLRAIVERATMVEPLKRYPSADEFAAALRSAAALPAGAEAQDKTGLWPIVGFDNTSRRLLEAACGLGDGGVLELAGPRGSGRSVLLRRLAWSLGVEDRPMVWLDESLAGAPAAIEQELAALEDPRAHLIVDEAEQLSDTNRARVNALLKRGARAVVTAATGLSEGARSIAQFDVPPLSDMTGQELVRRAMPSLPASVGITVLDFAGRRPGPLKRLLARLRDAAVVSAEDVIALAGDSPGAGPSEPPPAEAAHALLERGRLADAHKLLEAHEDDHSGLMQLARGRLAVGEGREHQAVGLLSAIETRSARVARMRDLWLSRAELTAGKTEQAKTRLDSLLQGSDSLAVEARAYLGLAEGQTGNSERALELLGEAAQLARAQGAHRVEAIASLCTGVVHLRLERMDQAQESYDLALAAAHRAADASTLTTTQSNLAVLKRRRGDLAGAIEHLEAAIDAGKRAGRWRAVRVALANLANTELYVGRLERAQQSIDALEQDRDKLDPRERGQLDGLHADYLSLSGETRGARAAYLRCAATYEGAGLARHAAEARLESVLLASNQDSVSLEDLAHVLEQAEKELADTPAHQPLRLTAEAHLAELAHDLGTTRKRLDAALEAAKATGARDWVWRTLQHRAKLSLRTGQPLAAQKDREQALLIVEAIAAGLPSDLREVYWSEPRRAKLRADLFDSTQALRQTSVRPSSRESTTRSAERELSRILEINRELLGEFDLTRLCSRVIDCAIELLRADRGFVLLAQPDGTLSVHASRDSQGDGARAEFSRSIAQRAMASDRPVVSLNARVDANLKGYASVHQLMLQAVACVPIRGRRKTAIGGLYLESSGSNSPNLERQMPTLEAFADQVGLAIETARLVNENVKRAAELSRTNRDLSAAQGRLKELLGERTEKLRVARRKLRDARETLYGHFGYQGLVGVSSEMRRVYALIDRVKDADVSVLICGESGTGKEVAAKAIHGASARSKQPFLGINCGAIPEHLLESELFGHVRGAFTGADRERKGLLREAGRGTVLLDEIGEMPQKMQAGLLRVLQERRARPVGGSAEEPIHCRLLFATHRNLKAMVAKGTFREDLFYRIMVVQLTLPPLRQHLEDIGALTDHFLRLFAARYKRERKSLTKEALRALASYDWPGNVRQLEHVLLNAWILGEDSEIDAHDLELPEKTASSSPPSKRKRPSSAAPTPVHAQPEPAEPRTGHEEHQADERGRIAEALAQTKWNRVKAAELLGMPRRTFYRRLKEYGLQ